MRHASLAALVVALLAACGGEADEGSTPATSEAAPETTTVPETTTMEATSEAAVTEETTTEAEAPKPPPGLPRFVAGYRDWAKLNDAPIPPRASDPHNGTKNVFATKRRRPNGLFPAGTVVVKEARRPGADFVGLVATMRKERGADPEHGDWIFVEYTREAAGDRFGEVASGAVCWSCHVGAQLDYVFTD